MIGTRSSIQPRLRVYIKFTDFITIVKQLSLLSTTYIERILSFHCHLRIFSGKIACANVISDLYAMGVTDCDNMLMLLGVSTKMTEKERDVVVPLIMRGFKDSAMEAGTTVTGGQTVVNPWCTIGGVATTVCQPNEYIVYVSKIYNLLHSLFAYNFY